MGPTGLDAGAETWHGRPARDRAWPGRPWHVDVAPTLRSAQKRGTGVPPVTGHGRDGHGTSMSADLKVSATSTAANHRRRISPPERRPLCPRFALQSPHRFSQSTAVARWQCDSSILILAAALAFALPPRAQQKPFTQEQVISMVRDGFGDDSGAKLIEQRGLDFAPAEQGSADLILRSAAFRYHGGKSRGP